MDNLYKLSFKDKATFDKIRTTLSEKLEDELVLKQGIVIAFEGHLPKDATYDEQGNELTEAGVHDDYSVDLISEKELPELTNFLITEKKQYKHCIAGGNFKIITK